MSLPYSSRAAMRNKLRLCLVFPHVRLGGGETAMMEVAEGLRRELDLDLCALDNADSETPGTIRDELAARFPGVTFVRRRWELRPRLAAADVVLWYGVLNTVPRLLAALPQRPVSVRVVHTDRHVDGAGFHRRWRRVIDGVVCVSPAAARRIPGAVFIPNPAPRGHLRGPARTDLFAERRKTLGFLGRLVPLKNVRWLVENVARIDCNLLVQALDSELQTAAELARLAEEKGVASRLRFLPPTRDVGTLLKSVDALVVASRHEGFPMVVIEAGTLGVPVISTRVGALPELFAEEVLFVDGDGDVPAIDSLRAAVARIGPDWGRRLQARVASLCDPEAVAARYTDFLRTVYEQRNIPA